MREIKTVRWETLVSLYKLQYLIVSFSHDLYTYLYALRVIN